MARGEVIIGKKIIQQRGGNFNKCLAASQTGFNNYVSFFRNYMAMNRKGMGKAFNRIYDYESSTLMTCVKMAYPQRKAYTNWNYCVASGMDLMVNDRLFQAEYMGKKKSNWKKLGTLIAKITMDKLIGASACQRNAHYNLRFTVTKKQLG